MFAHEPIALCSAADGLVRAACVTDLAGRAPEWIEALPIGRFRARDGRGWFVDDPGALIAATRERAGRTDLVIDYEHQSRSAERNGRAAPAAGWIKRLEVRGGSIWARVDWNRRARELIEAREYRYFSPVFTHDKAGVVKALVAGGLTNTPALELAALARTEDISMNEEQRAAMRKALGLPDDADDAAIVAAAAGAARRSGILTALAGALGVSDDATGEQFAVALARTRAGPADPDASKWVPRPEFDAVAGSLKRLQDELAESGAAAAVDGAVAEGKIAPAQRDWATAYARSDPDGFKAYVSNAPRIVDPRPSGAPAARPDPNAELTADELAVCRAMGVSQESFKAARAADPEWTTATGAAS